MGAGTGCAYGLMGCAGSVAGPATSTVPYGSTGCWAWATPAKTNRAARLNAVLMRASYRAGASTGNVPPAVTKINRRDAGLSILWEPLWTPVGASVWTFVHDTGRTGLR